MLESKTILIIEDEPDFLRIYSDLLKSKGYEVMEASRGDDGLAKIEAHQPDLVLLDLVLPGLAGFDILDTMRKQEKTKDIPVIIFSVLGDGENIHKALTMGAQDFAIKGYNKPKDILDKIDHVLQTPVSATSPLPYELMVRDSVLDAPKIALLLGLEAGLQCPDCRQPLVIKLLSDYTRNDGHWFFSYVCCNRCQRTF
jgi:DNA-binding response OmpR family regulator